MRRSAPMHIADDFLWIELSPSSGGCLNGGSTFCIVPVFLHSDMQLVVFAKFFLVGQFSFSVGPVICLALFVALLFIFMVVGKMSSIVGRNVLYPFSSIVFSVFLRISDSICSMPSSMIGKISLVVNVCQLVLPKVTQIVMHKAAVQYPAAHKLPATSQRQIANAYSVMIRKLKIRGSSRNAIKSRASSAEHGCHRG